MSKRSINELIIEEPESVQSPSLVPLPTEEVALRVMSIMGEAYGALPTSFWGLSQSADLLAPRGFVVSCSDSFDAYNRRLKAVGAYPIVSLRTKWWSEYGPLIVLAGVKKVTIGEPDFNGELKLGESVEEVTFDRVSQFNRPLELPAGLKKIAFAKAYKFPLTLPVGLTEITFPYYSGFNHPITLPDSIRVAKFGYAFNHVLRLPPSIVEWESGFTFNNPIDFTGCTKLRVITFGDRFNTLVSLPESVEEVNFGHSFNLPVALPANVRKVTFGGSYNCPISITPRIGELTFYGRGVFNQPLIFPEDSCIKTLRLSNSFNQAIDLVEGLENVYFGQEYNLPLNLPSTLKQLEFTVESKFNQHIQLPGGLKEARFGFHMHHQLDFPLGIEKIDWYGDPLVKLPEGFEVISCRS